MNENLIKNYNCIFLKIPWGVFSKSDPMYPCRHCSFKGSYCEAIGRGLLCTFHGKKNNDGTPKWEQAVFKKLEVRKNESESNI